MKTARGLLINITGSLDMTLMEVDEAVNRILEEVDSEAEMIFGSTFDDNLEGRIRISVVATGIDAGEETQARPATIFRPRPVANAEPKTAAEPLSEPEPVAARVAPAADSATGSGEVVTLLDEAPALATGGPTADAAVTEPLPDADAYIPPAPVKPDEKTLPADPFAEAAFENGGAGKRKRQSLFERVAEAAGVVSGERRTQLSQRVEPVATPTGAAPPRQTRPAAVDVRQPPLGGLDPAGAGGRTDAEGEMLDIPAFLRRQAN